MASQKTQNLLVSLTTSTISTNHYILNVIVLKENQGKKKSPGRKDKGMNYSPHS